MRLELTVILFNELEYSFFLKLHKRRCSRLNKAKRFAKQQNSNALVCVYRAIPFVQSETVIREKSRRAN